MLRGESLVVEGRKKSFGGLIGRKESFGGIIGRNLGLR